MASCYEAIRNEHIRGYGEYTHHLEFLGRIYADRTHFIYELLQNFEDAGATKVKFTLLAHCLEIRHDGRPFNTDDVRGICGVGKGTKAEDLTQIGKFGIGFKSVYAYTNTPKIHSVGGPDGREDFCIKHYVRPEAVATRDPGEGWTTLIVMPFDHNDVAAEDAKSQISRRLRELNVRTLLFLRNIDEVSYSDDGAVGALTGTYLRETRRVSAARHVTVMGENNGEREIKSESWYIFDQSVPLEEEQKDVYIEIAFQCATDEKTKQEMVVPISRSPLVVFFPTDKETALGFLIQGPYRTTPARDNVPLGDEWNANLVHKTAKLVIDALEKLKLMNLLSVDVLTALPIKPSSKSYASTMFRPIYDEVCTALLQKPLLPTDDGTYVPGNGAKLGRGESLRKLLSPAQLSQLYGTGEPIKWLHGEITSDRNSTLRDYLMQELHIVEITPERFAQDITTAFLKEQNDGWIVKFYRFLKEQESLWRKKSGSVNPGLLRSKEIIRLESGRHVAPFDSKDCPNAFLTGSGTLDEYPTVLAKAVDDPDALDFLQRLGIRKVEQEDEIQKILNSYYRHKMQNLTSDQHLKHITLFVNWHKKNVGTALFKDMYLLAGEDGTRLYQPKDCYLDLPYEDTRLSCVFDELQFDAAGLIKQRIWAGYVGIEGFVEFAKAMGVSYNLEVMKRKVDRDHPYADCLLKPFINASRTKHEVSEDYWIVGLDTLVGASRVEVSRLIWDYMCSADRKVLQARYSPNNRHPERVSPSSLVHALAGAQWIPNKVGTFHVPCEMTKDLLPDGFLYDDGNGWLKAIEFGEIAKQSERHHAQSLGIRKLELIDLMKQIQDDEGLLNKIMSVVKKLKPHRAEFPVRPVRNPDRRSERIIQEYKDSSNKTYEHRQRNVRVSEPENKPDVWLRNQYTNDNGEMVCQVCHDEMPFRKRDGEYYFEAVEMLLREDFHKENPAQYIAVCPLCSAKYKEFVKRDSSMATDIRRKLVGATEPEVAVAFGEEEVVIRFVETHWHDLRRILDSNVKTTK
jgi:hypothetical protein